MLKKPALMRTLVPFFFYIFLWNISLAQSQINTDSLKQVWNDTNLPDSSRLNAVTELVWSLDTIYFEEVYDTIFVLTHSLVEDYQEGYNNYQYVFPKTRQLEQNTYLNIPDQVERAFLKNLELAERINFRKGIVLSYRGLSNLYFKLQQYDEAIETFNEYLRLAMETKYQKCIEHALRRLANIYRIRGNYGKALEYLTKAERLVQEGTFELNLKSIFGGMGNIYRLQGDYSNALHYYQKQLSLVEKTSKQRFLSQPYYSIGMTYAEMGNYDESLKYAKKTLDVATKFNYKLYKSIAFYLFGDIYNKLGKYQLAIENFTNSLKLEKELNSDGGIAYAYWGLGNAYLELNQYDRAIRFCKKAQHIFQVLQMKIDEKDACQCLYEGYKQSEQSNQALYYLEKINILEDSLKKDEVVQQLQQMEFSKQKLADSLQQVEENLKIEIAHQTELNKKNRTRNILLGSSFLIFLLAVGLWSRLRYIRKSKAEIEKEKDRSENLLLNILPAEVAQELKEKGKAAARNYDMVSILFTDFKSFTELSEQVSPEELVTEVNACFEAFDIIVEKYKIEKIKTIGDSYMAASNLPVPIENAEKNTVLAALEMQEFISQRKKERDVKGLLAFEMRIGIHTGPVVAGIVGIKKFQYDLWGDTVNTASRMENQSAIGQVNISQDTYELLKGDADFSFEKRGKIEVKGKGMMEMYFVKKKSLEIDIIQ